MLKYFATRADKVLIADPGEIQRLFKHYRLRVFVWLVLGYGFFYTCRLSLSVAKKPMLDAGVLSVDEMGIIGAVLLYVYAFGKLINGFLADRANIKRFMSWALAGSAIANLLFGFTGWFWAFAILWGVNGWFQSIGSAPSVVSLCQWFSQRERGTRYGLWAGAHNIGEGMTFIGTALIVDHFGWRWGFWGPGIVCLLVAMILFRNLADRPQTYGLPAIADHNNDIGAGQSSSKDTLARIQFSILKHPLLWVFGLSSACMYIARYAINSWAIFFLQQGKGYELVDAASAMAAYPIFGLAGAVFSGLISDKLFRARRDIPTLMYGVLLVTALTSFYLIPPGYLWLDAIALGAFGFAIGGLVVFLAGLTAIDLLPVRAAGAVKGVIGLFSYLGAATQDWVSGLMIESTKQVADGVASYDFKNVFIFWIGAAVASILLAMIAWNAKPRE
ncbi:MAG: MFS transporter [Woeseiaceae bacterium]